MKWCTRSGQKKLMMVNVAEGMAEYAIKHVNVVVMHLRLTYSLPSQSVFFLRFNSVVLRCTTIGYYSCTVYTLRVLYNASLCIVVSQRIIIVAQKTQRADGERKEEP